MKVPAVNASFAGDAIIQYGSVNLSVAVAVEEGLVTPVIRDAQKKSLREISEAVKDLASRARGKKLKPDEYAGGTITVSNLGSYGIESFSAIINPPQALIITVGAIVKKPVVNAKDEIVVGQRMAIGLSADHRVVDGAVGAQYLAELRKLIESAERSCCFDPPRFCLVVGQASSLSPPGFHPRKHWGWKLPDWLGKPFPTALSARWTAARTRFMVRKFPAHSHRNDASNFLASNSRHAFSARRILDRWRVCRVADFRRAFPVPAKARE